MGAPAALDVNGAEVARQLGVSRYAVSRFRSGERTPRFSTQEKIAKLLGWPVSEQADALSHRRWTRDFNRKLSEWAAH